MKSLVFVTLASLFLIPAVFTQNTSVYTSTKTDACRTVESSTDGTGFYLGECKGVGRYKVQLLEGDIRQTLNIITPAGKKFELNFWRIFGSFSSIGEKIEWRMKGRTPVALIARYNVSNPEDTQKTTSYLMISKIGTTASCVTDFVEPKPRQNEIARELADKAADRPCKTGS